MLLSGPNPTPLIPAKAGTQAFSVPSGAWMGLGG
jgi:hypothetical protein